jgi:hypothetical protein
MKPCLGHSFGLLYLSSALGKLPRPPGLNSLTLPPQTLSQTVSSRPLCPPAPLPSWKRVICASRFRNQTLKLFPTLTATQHCRSSTHPTSSVAATRPTTRAQQYWCADIHFVSLTQCNAQIPCFNVTSSNFTAPPDDGEDGEDDSSSGGSSSSESSSNDTSSTSDGNNGAGVMVQPSPVGVFVTVALGAAALAAGLM